MQKVTCKFTFQPRLFLWKVKQSTRKFISLSIIRPYFEKKSEIQMAEGDCSKIFSHLLLYMLSSPSKNQLDLYQHRCTFLSNCLILSQVQPVPVLTKMSKNTSPPPPKKNATVFVCPPFFCYLIERRLKAPLGT